jgi:glycerol-3-phosphate O-acyltransferase
VTELLGHEKKSESLMSFLDSRKIMSLKMGRVDVRFGEAWSLRQWVTGQLQVAEMERFPLAQPIPKETHLYILRSLGYRILADINNASVVMPTALVGATLMTWAGRGISLNQLNRRVSWLINKVQEAGGRLGAMSTMDSSADRQGKTINVDAVVQNALKVLGNDLVGVEHKKLLEPVYYPKDPFRLSYYRNQIIYLFISEAIVSLAMFTLLRQSGSRRMNRSSVAEVSKFLSTLLSGEFVFQPEGLQTNLQNTLDKLAKQGVVTIDGDEVELSLSEINSGCEVFDFYCFLIWPFIDGYWAASVALYSLADGRSIPEKQFHAQAQSLAKTLYAQGELTHYEALNKEMLKFAFQHYEVRGIIKREPNEQLGYCVTLGSSWIPPRDASGHILLEGPLYEFSETIALSRNRPLRHGVTNVLNNRILGLTASVAATYKL